MARKPADNTESAQATEEENLESPAESTEDQIETKEAIAPEESTPEETAIEKKEETVVTEEPGVPHETILPEEPAVTDEITLPTDETPPVDPITPEVIEETDENVDPGKGLIQATIDNLSRDEQELFMAAIVDIQKSALPRETIASIVINTFFDKVIAKEPESEVTLVAISNKVAEVNQHEIFQSFVGELEGILSSGLEPAFKLSVLSGSLDTLAGKLG